MAKQSHGIRLGAGLGVRVIEPRSRLDAESPSVPGARDAVVLDVASSQRGSHVWTEVVDRGVFSLYEEDRDHLAVDAKRPAFPFGNVADMSHGLKFRHQTTPLD